MRTLPLFAVALIACAGSFEASVARGQQNSPRIVERAEPKEDPETDPETETETVTLEFEGGTLAEFVEAMREVAGRLNVSFPRELGEVDVPPLQLTDVELYAALQTACLASEARMRAHVLPTNGGAPVFILEAVDTENPFGMGGSGIGGSFPSQTATRVQGRELRIFSLTELVAATESEDDSSEGFKEEVILTAMETAVQSAEVDQGAAPASIKYHKESELLIIVGEQSHLEAAGQVIKSLQLGLLARRDRGRPRSKDTAQLRYEPASVSTSQLYEAIRAIAPPTVKGRSPLSTEIDGEAVMVTCDADFADAVEAVVRYVDRLVLPSREEEKLRIQLEAAREEMVAQRVFLDRMRDESLEMQRDVIAQREAIERDIAMENAQQRLEFAAREKELRDRIAELEAAAKRPQ